MHKNPPFPSKTLNDTHDIMTFMTHCTAVDLFYKFVVTMNFSFNE